MWWNKLVFILATAIISGCSTTSNHSNSICPERPNTYVKAIGVYDGPIADLALLLPDEASETDGFWNLAYVYDAGRTVNVRCQYSDKTNLDIHLEQPVDQCRFQIVNETSTIFRCR
ncbi:STY0301 family protein [Saccharophagus sp. K07]|jgi:hypothetical protein|uniref:STY0301 family protein n=1 Tax=Saccharophagus sp. K07 TaxID=2283636 RepID=UPI0016525F99|nr:STY0301 family protein [Saccharophagus sp. K07]